jgi:two-component system sensor histidine kinase AdeS
MLILSVAMSYVGVTWYSSFLDDGINRNLPPESALALKTIQQGGIPDGTSLRSLLDTMEEEDAKADIKIQLSALICGLISALICSLIGVYFARRIARPLAQLTSAAEALRGGDFSVRVEASAGNTHEVASLVETFNRLARSLDHMETRLRFNNMAVAHELRTPLTILQGGLQAMIDGVFPLTRGSVADLLVQVEGLAKIVEDLRTLSLAAGHKLVTQRERTNLADIVASVIASSIPVLEERKFEIETGLAPAWVSADPQRIRQAVLALLDNAVRYAESGRWLRFETHQLPDNQAVIHVIDHGPGFPEEMDATSIDLFWRGDVSRSRETGGTGLGLSVVQAIAVAHGGYLEFKNRAHGGAVITIHIR